MNKSRKPSFRARVRTDVRRRAHSRLWREIDRALASGITEDEVSGAIVLVAAVRRAGGALTGGAA